MSANFTAVKESLVEKGFELTEQNAYSTTYAKWNTSDKGWTEIILDNEYNEVIKDVYAADNRRLNRATADIKNTQAVFRLIG
jgi:hypothetical protein